MIKTQIGCIMNLPMWVNFLSRKQIMFFPGVYYLLFLSPDLAIIVRDMHIPNGA